MPHLFSCLLKFAPFAGRRSAHARWWLGARIALLSMVAVDASALVEAYPLAAQLREARVLAGVSPERAFAVLERLRQEAVRIQSLAARLEADEIECRLLTDIDPEKGLKIGQAGLAAVGDRTLSGAAQLNQLRLQICIDSVRAEDDQHAEGVASFDAIVAMTAQQPDMASARALALLERGVYHSRRGDLSKGQQDLLTACDLLRRVGQPRDLDLCMGHLANHYKRMGALDDALRYLQQLTDAARTRGALFDQGIYAFSLAQVHAKRADWPQALHHYEEALSLAPFSDDPVNVGYAEGGIGEVMLEQGRANEAELHFRKAIKLLDGSFERKQVLRLKVSLAAAMTAQHNAAPAVRALNEIRPAIDALADALLLSHWLETAAKARAGVEDWRGAYEALAAFREVDARIQTQRLSDQSARLRVQFNQEKDAQDMAALRELNDRGQELRHTQAIALGLFVLLLVLTLAYTVHKFRQAKRLETLALSDELTGLPNRRAVLARADALIESARREGHPFSLLLVDVDHFKRINDSHGHAVGDEVLRHLAQRLPVGLRTSDVLGRVGGEEFLAVLPEASAQQALAVAERIRAAIEQSPAATAAGPLWQTVSIGLASTTDPQAGVIDLMRQADEALYTAKAQGRNRVVLARAAGEAGRESPPGAATPRPPEPTVVAEPPESSMPSPSTGRVLPTEPPATESTH